MYTVHGHGASLWRSSYFMIFILQLSDCRGASTSIAIVLALQRRIQSAPPLIYVGEEPVPLQVAHERRREGVVRGAQLRAQQQRGRCRRVLQC